jgi:ribulose kinase
MFQYQMSMQVKAKDDTPVIGTAVSHAMATRDTTHLQQALAKPGSQETMKTNISNNSRVHDVIQKQVRIGFHDEITAAAVNRSQALFQQ